MGTTLTAQEMAQTILGADRTAPGTLNMQHWVEFPFGGALDDGDGTTRELAPETDPTTCGTTMCLAGWAAHFAGYTLRSSVYSPAESYTAAVGRDGVARSVDIVGRLAWGLTAPNATVLFFCTDNDARRWLGLVAGGMGVNEAVEAVFGSSACDTEGY